jgi:trans-aconitate 2-methyltransferase
MASEWDARTYDRIAAPQTRWGRAVVERAPVRGDERVLDAGCGTGRVTEMLLARLPRGRLVALDGSAAMIAEARRRLGGDGRIEYVVADLAGPLYLDGPVDGVFSTAAFHWVLDHDALFAHLGAVLRPGGWLCAQCGGAGNVASVHEAVRALDPSLPWNMTFATPAETEARLARAGFSRAHAWLERQEAAFDNLPDLETFLATVVLKEILTEIAEPDRAAFLHDVAARLPALKVDYVRLNIDAVK